MMVSTREGKDMSPKHIDNTEAVKSKKKKEKIEVPVSKVSVFEYDGIKYTGEDLAGIADALAGAKISTKAIEKTAKEHQEILKAYMYQNWCENFALNGDAPDMRELIGGASRFEISQYRKADIPDSVATAIAELGLDIKKYSTQTKYEIRMGNVPEPMVEKVLGAIQDVLGKATYDNVVTKKHVLGNSFFDNYLEIVKEHCGKGEKLAEKMTKILGMLGPVVQFLKPATDLSETESFDLAFKFAEISAKEKKRKK